MNDGNHGDALRLKDILWAISALDRHRSGGRESFDADELLRHFVWKQIEIIGEAASKIGTELRTTHPEVAWMQIIGMRNRLVHGQEVGVRLFARNDDVDVLARPQAVVIGGQQRVGVWWQVHPDHRRALIHHMVDETRILMAESVVILSPDMAGE
jgi:uncharacterized protein with HEPN domain